MTDFTPLIYMSVGALGSLVMWLILGPVMTGLGVKRLAKKARDGDEKALEFFYDLGDVLIKWASEPRIETGEILKQDTGKVDQDGNMITKNVKEVITPVEMIARVVGNYAVMHMKGFMGGKKTQMKAQMEEAIAQSGGDIKALIPLALSAASRGDYGPAIGIIMQKLLSDDTLFKPKQGGSNTGW